MRSNDLTAASPRALGPQTRPRAGSGALPLQDIIGWDVGNWSKALAYWQPWLTAPAPNNKKVLTLGERNGGLSLWFALQGFDVVCTDYHALGEKVRLLHSRWQVQERLTYGFADVFHLGFADSCFDVVACKSVIGGLSLDYKDRSTRTLENQKMAVSEMRRVLKPGGVFFGAENLTGTHLHSALRNLRHKGNPGWRYLRMSEIRWLFDEYSTCEQKPYGFVGTQWPNRFGLNRACAVMDACLARILPADCFYISFIRARK